MKGQVKSRKVAGFVRTVVGTNVQQLMELEYPLASNQPMALAKAAGVSLSTVQRVIKGATGPSLDTLEAIALTFGVSTYQLLIPSLDPKNPQVAPGASEAEKRLYRAYRQAKLKETTQ